MSPFGFGMLGCCLGLPLLIAQWIGVIGFRKARKDGAWWCMGCGTAIQSISTLGQLTGFAMLFWGIGGQTWLLTLMVALGAASGLGSLIFALGFALTGYRASRVIDRTAELEMMNLAQAAELERLRNR